MNVLIVGSGGREHALAWAVSRSPRVDRLFVAPGNGGTASLGENVELDAGDAAAIVEFARTACIDLVVVGPEAPLVAGLADRLRDAGIAVYGPPAEAARLEGSKVFAKRFMAEHGIPTADFDACDDAEAAHAAVERRGAPVVVKADGLAAGKGVVVASTLDEAHAAVDAMMVEGRFGEAGVRVVVEEALEGEELSVHAVCAGRSARLLPPSQDHKRVGEGDTGPNTGGMGAVAPVPGVDAAELELVRRRIVEPVLRGLDARGAPFAGTLYAGLMRTAQGPKVLEFNVRFGDPEAQVLLPLLRGDVLDLLDGAARGALPDAAVVDADRAAATVVLASRGYPGACEKGFVIEGLDAIDDERVVVFHAGTRLDVDGTVRTSGGRVLAVTGVDATLAGALDAAYAAVDRIRFEGAFCRRDIGRRALAARGDEC